MKAIDTLTDVVGLYALTPHGELGVYTERGRISIVHASTQVLGPQIRQLLKTYLADPDTSEYRLGVVYRRVDQTSSQGDTLRLEERALQQLFPAGAPATQGRTELQAANCEQNIRRGIQLLSTRRQPQFADAPVYLPVLYDRGTTLDQYSNRRAGRPTPNGSQAVLEVLNLMPMFSFGRRHMPLLTILTQAMQRYTTPERGGGDREVSVRPGRKVQPRRDRSRTVFFGEVEKFDSADEPRLAVGPATQTERFEPMERWLEQPRRTRDAAALRGFAPFRDLDDERLTAASKKLPVYAAPRGVRLLDIGLMDAWNMFLLEGTVALQAADGDALLVAGGSDKATSAISFLKPRKYTVTSVTAVRFLWVHDVLL